MGHLVHDDTRDIPASQGNMKLIPGQKVCILLEHKLLGAFGFLGNYI